MPVRVSIGSALVLLVMVACKSSARVSEADDVPETKRYVFKHEGLVRDVAVFDPDAPRKEARALWSSCFTVGSALTTMR